MSSESYELKALFWRWGGGVKGVVSLLVLMDAFMLQECVVTVTTKESLGSIALVRLCLEGRPGFPDLDWLCQGVEVTALSSAPEGEQHTEYFPCSKWLRTADGSIVLWSRRGLSC